MIHVKYKKTDMIVQAIGCAMLAAGSIWGFMEIDGVQASIAFAVLALCLPVVAVALIIRASGDLTAIRVGRGGLDVATLWRTSHAPWRSIKSIHREELQQTSGWGLFKQTVGWYLVIVSHEGDGFEKREKLNEKLLDLPRGSIDALVERLHIAWAAGLTGRAVDAPVAPATAAIDAPVRPTFGRKIA